MAWLLCLAVEGGAIRIIGLPGSKTTQGTTHSPQYELEEFRITHLSLTFNGLLDEEECSKRRGKFAE